MNIDIQKFKFTLVVIAKELERIYRIPIGNLVTLIDINFFKIIVFI